MKLRYLIIFAFIQTTALAGCEWKNTNGLYKDYIHEDEGDGNGGHIVPCPGFFHPAVEGVTPAYYELSSGRCYKTEDLENIPVADKNAKLISFDNIKTLQSLQDYKICEIFRSEPGYYFDQEESPAKLTYIGEYKGIERFFERNRGYNYEEELKNDRNNRVNDDRYNDTIDKYHVCPNDYPVCTPYYLNEQNTRLYFESFWDYNRDDTCVNQEANYYCHINEDRIKDEVEEFYKKQSFKKDHRFYEFICTKPSDLISLEVGCDRGMINCDGFCINPDTNPHHCGAVGTCSSDDPKHINFEGFVCNPDENCIDGKCEPITDLIICQEGIDDIKFDKYIDPHSDNNYCGARGKCNSDDEESDDFRGVECNTPAEQCLEGKCVFVSCEEETDMKLCTTNGQSECTYLITEEHCGSCFQPCYHPQTDVVDAECIDFREEGINRGIECVYTCKEGYIEETPTNDSHDKVCISQDYFCDETKPVNKQCDDGKICINKECVENNCQDAKCPDLNGQCIEQNFHHCGSSCLDCNSLHAVNGDCDNGKCVITECETGFHLSPDKTQCILNSETECAPVNSSDVRNCTINNENSYIYNCINGECKNTACTDNANMTITNDEIICDSNDDPQHCGPNLMDCTLININLPNKSEVFDCAPYESTAIKFDNYLNGNVCQLAIINQKPYCESLTNEFSSYHNSANNQSCRIDTHYDCGPRHETCKKNEICTFDLGLNIYKCTQISSNKQLNQCNEGSACLDGFKTGQECVNNVCQDLKINDTSCYEIDSYSVNCVALRHKATLIGQDIIPNPDKIPTGTCEYFPELIVNLANPFDPIPVLQKGNWRCACPKGEVLCSDMPCGDYEINDDNSEYFSTLRCQTVDECKKTLFNCLNQSDQPEPEG